MSIKFVIKIKAYGLGHSCFILGIYQWIIVYTSHFARYPHTTPIKEHEEEEMKAFSENTN